MATIALYANKINQMSGLISNFKQAVSEYKSELFSLQTKTLTVNRSVCNLDYVLSSIQSSSQIQEHIIIVLDDLNDNCEDYISQVCCIDDNVADVINQSKDDFYDEYCYLKPECEKSCWEKFCEQLDSVGDWLKKHWKEILIGLACIVIGALLTFLTGGAFLAALAVGLKAAAIAALISGGISAGISIIISIIDGDGFATTLGKTVKAFFDGAASGFMWGGIFAGGSQAISGIMRLSSKLGVTSKILGKFKLWSPNSLTNPNSGGTLFKIGKTFRIDFEAGKQLFHTHITKKMFEKLPAFLKGMKWLFDPSKNDVHVRLTSLLGGIFGAIFKKK